MRSVIFSLVLLASSAAAELRPVPAEGGDPRIQTVLYDPQQVIQLQVASGYQLTLEFGPDERIETVAVGDSGAWQVTPNKRGDHLFIKSGQGGVTTNMTVVTDSRTYNFLLSPAYGPTPDMAFVVRLRFPPAAAATVADAGSAQAEIGRYKLGGDRALRPIAIDDDGVHTYIDWAPRQTLPAIFAIDPLGKESLVNGSVRDGHYVIDGVANRLVFRIDRQTAFATRRPKLPV